MLGGVLALSCGFLLQEGLIQRNLAAAVPTVARWRLASLPTTLRQDEVNRLLRAADLETPFGRRDYAIVLCISELGLRASDVANLEIDGIDFNAQVLRLRQRKEREAAVFPMTRRLCSALKAYLRHDRPACTFDGGIHSTPCPAGDSAHFPWNLPRGSATGMPGRLTAPHRRHACAASKPCQPDVGCRCDTQADCRLPGTHVHRHHDLVRQG